MHSPPLILVVDDHDDARAIHGFSLEQNGYQIAFARNGLEALAIVGERLPDLVLLDLVMPEMDGWEVARRLRANRQTNDIPVIALTAHHEEGNRVRALQAGCDLVLTKPCQPDALVARVRSRLKNRH